MFRKRLSVILSMIMVAAMIPVLAGETDAETIPSFNAQKSVNFAVSTTKNYKDCVKFARAASEKGGVPVEKNRSYNYNTKSYADYLVNNGYAVKNKLTLCGDEQTEIEDGKYGNVRCEDNKGKIAEGDVLAYHCKKCSKWFHMAVVTGKCKSKYPVENERYDHFWKIYAQSANGKLIKNQPVYVYEHSGHGRSNVEIYVLHMTSSDNGFKACTAKVTGLKAKKVTTKKAKLSWKAKSGAKAYRIYARGYDGGTVDYIKQVTGTSATVAIPKNSSGKYYNYKKVKFTVAPVMSQKVTFEGVTKTYKVTGKKCTLVSVK